MNARKGFTPGQLRDLVYMQGGLCPECGGTINIARGDAVEIDHRIPLALGGSNEWSNMQAIHVACHLGKTRSDRRQIAKAQRVAAKHSGTHRPAKHKLPGHKDDWMKRKVGGRAVVRSTGEPIGGRK